MPTVPLFPTHEGPMDDTPVARAQVKRELISNLNGLTQRVLNSDYPQAEVVSWDIQKSDAERFLAAGSGATLEHAPFLARVCYHHFQGTFTDAQKLQHLRDKVAAVMGNVYNWAEIAAFVNGLRARYEEAIDAALTPADVYEQLRLARNEIEAFRTAAGL